MKSFKRWLYVFVSTAKHQSFSFFLPLHDSACEPDSVLWLSFQLQDSDSLHRWPVWKYLQCMCTRFSVVTVFSVWPVWEIPAVRVHQIQHRDCLFSFKPVICYINDQFDRYLQCMCTTQCCDCLFSFKPVIRYIDDQFERYLQDESGLNRRHIIDNRVHCCFYFINPSGHGLVVFLSDCSRQLFLLVFVSLVAQFKIKQYLCTKRIITN